MGIKTILKKYEIKKMVEEYKLEGIDKDKLKGIKIIVTEWVKENIPRDGDGNNKWRILRK